MTSDALSQFIVPTNIRVRTRGRRRCRCGDQRHVVAAERTIDKGLLLIARGIHHSVARRERKGAFARAEFGAGSMEMTVIRQRESLVAWYERRGYQRTGETRPFPYDDERFGSPKVPGLEFVTLAKPLG